VVPYDISFSSVGTIPGPSMILACCVTARGLSILAANPGQIKVLTAPAATTTVDVLHNNVVIGTCTVLTGATSGTIVLTADVLAASGDVFILKSAATIDSTVSDIMVTLIAQVV